MKYIADLHIHSRYSRATSRELNLDSIYKWAKIKGINVVGTGDFTHPQWLDEIKEKLVPDGSGFFRLKEPPESKSLPGTQDIDVRFCLSAEISSIYKFENRVRKNHNLIFAANLETVTKINARLSEIGNLKSDGRPILGLPSRNLLEIVLNTSEDAHLIPAHVWTPWFSTLGSKAGYDSIEECFRDLSEHIFALETGLSSDPAMNWRLSELDRYSLVSNSDAHSPRKLGREANIFDTELNYFDMFDALKTKEGFLGTYEMFPEEGKYHLDGHRKCGIVFEPETTIQYNNICPVCKKPLTVGVLHRVERLSDRKKSLKPEDSPGFQYVIPLPEILSEIKGSGPGSKIVEQAYNQIISGFGNEFTFVKEVPIEDIRKKCGYVISEAIRRMRESQVKPIAGYDGEYGIIKIFNEGELASLQGQSNLFGFETEKMTDRKVIQTEIKDNDTDNREELPEAFQPDEEQESAANFTSGALVVKAGPGTGKTGTLISWIASQVENNGINPEEVIAVTFTNKAADEMKVRLKNLIGERSGKITTGTFHSLCYNILRKRNPEINTVHDSAGREIVLNILFPELKSNEIKKLSYALEQYFENGDSPGHDIIAETAEKYRDYTRKNNSVDLSDIIYQTVTLFNDEPDFLDDIRRQYKAIAIDEFQDINPMQYRFIKYLAEDKNVLAIGDPDQSIYGFRGSDVKLFFRFRDEFNAHKINLERNYRSSEIIVKAAENVIANNTVKSDLNLKALSNNWKKIKVFNAGDTVAETKYIFDEILKYVGGAGNMPVDAPSCHYNYSFSDLAVLFRTHAVGKGLLRELKKSGIPVHYGDGSSYLSEPPFSLVSCILRLLLNPGDYVSLKSLLINGLEWSQPDSDIFIRSLYSGVSDWTQDSCKLPDERYRKIFKEWQEFYCSLKESYSAENPESLVTSVCNYILPDDKLDELQILKKEAVIKMACESMDSADIFLQRMILGNYTDIGRLKSEAVNLLTFHAAKGLEFPVVFIAGAEESITPITSTGADIEEERRLFYVALTRAKDEVHITCSANRKFFGRTDTMEPSRFISEISAELKDKVTQEPKKKDITKEKQLSLF
jgi:DNA helicase-2/ATP-dependent DNA helicase PcrA